MAFNTRWWRRTGLAILLALLAVLTATTVLRTDTPGPREEPPAEPQVAVGGNTAPRIVQSRVTVTRTRVREPDPSPEGRLVDAARHGRVDEVRDLLGEGVAVTAADRNGDLPLHQAARAASAEAVELLLAGGADPNVSDGFGWFPVSYAIWAGSLAVTERLLAAGADVPSRVSGGSPLEPLIGGWLIAEAGVPDAPGKREAERVEVARAILAAGDVAELAGVLEKAITQMKHEGLVAVLLEHGARLDTTTSGGAALMRLRGPIGDGLRETVQQDSVPAEEAMR